MAHATQGRSGKGTKLYIGDAGVGAGTKASRTIGTGASALKIEAQDAGTPGNSKTFGIVVAGNNTAYSQVITPNSVLINSATDGSGVATTTVLDAIEQLYSSEVFQANFNASSPGTGTGVLTAGAASALSGGAYGTETFSQVVDIKSIGGPQRDTTFLDGTHLDSEGGYEEMIPHFKTSGEVPLEIQWRPEDTTTQKTLEDLHESQALRTFYIGWPGRDGNVIRYDSFSAYVKSFQTTAESGAVLAASCSLQISGPVSTRVAAPNIV